VESAVSFIEMTSFLRTSNRKFNWTLSLNIGAGEIQIAIVIKSTFCPCYFILSTTDRVASKRFSLEISGRDFVNIYLQKVKYARISLCRNWVIVKDTKEKKTSRFITYGCITNNLATFQLEIGGITPERRWQLWCRMRKILFHIELWGLFKL